MLSSGHPGLRYQGCSGLAPGNAERHKSFFTATLYLVWLCSVPREVRFQHDISPRCAYRLASTCWANGQLEVIPCLTSSETTDGAKSLAGDLHCDGTTQTRQADASLVMAGGSAFQTNTS